MQIVIDIPDEMYDSIKLGMRHADDAAFVMEQIDNNSIILPKKHGRLIDEDRLMYRLKDSYLDSWGLLKVENVLKELPTVIEAAKEGHNDS